MKIAYLEASKAYFGAIAKATPEQRLQSEVDESSVADGLQELLLDLDYSDMYEDGTMYDELEEPYSSEYRQWVKDWELPEPNGKPNYDFDINDYIEQSK